MPISLKRFFLSFFFLTKLSRKGFWTLKWSIKVRFFIDCTSFPDHYSFLNNFKNIIYLISLESHGRVECLCKKGTNWKTWTQKLQSFLIIKMQFLFLKISLPEYNFVISNINQEFSIIKWRSKIFTSYISIKYYQIFFFTF